MKKWHEINLNPNDLSVINYRKNSILNAEDVNLIGDRIEYLSELVKNKSVLDIGCVAHVTEAEKEKQWLHKYISQSSSYCLGVDILEKEVNALKELGYNIICQDIIANPLKEKFDVIICGEVIEHLNNVGDFFKSITNNLNKHGRLVITVPNPWYINVIIKNIFSKSSYIDNADHVSWFDPCTLTEIGSRHNLVLEKFAGIKVDQYLTLKSKIFFRLVPLLLSAGISSRVFAKTMIYEFIFDEENIAN